MLRIIDKSTTHIIQKVISPKGERIAYQTVPLNPVNGQPWVGDTGLITRCSSLAQAREIAKTDVPLACAWPRN